MALRVGRAPGRRLPRDVDSGYVARNCAGGSGRLIFEGVVSGGKDGTGKKRTRAGIPDGWVVRGGRESTAWPRLPPK